MGSQSKIVIGIDQSYTDTGIGLARNGKLLFLQDCDFKGCDTNTEKRKHLENELRTLIETISIKNVNEDPVIIIMERIRQFSKGTDSFISMPYIKAAATLYAVVIDLAWEYSIPVYSVDTRAWKAQILGSAKSKVKKKGMASKKETSIEKVIELGFYEDIKYVVKAGPNKGEVRFNDNMADAGCIALYGFIPKDAQKLKLENF
jgi:hypothetical protein